MLSPAHESDCCDCGRYGFACRVLLPGDVLKLLLLVAEEVPAAAAAATAENGSPCEVGLRAL